MGGYGHSPLIYGRREQQTETGTALGVNQFSLPVSCENGDPAGAHFSSLVPRFSTCPDERKPEEVGS